MKHGVVRNVVDPCAQFFFGGQFAKQQQVRDFEESTALGQNLNGVSAIAQNALIAVDISDGTFTRRGVHERWIVSHDAEVVGACLNLAQIHCPNRAVLHRYGIALLGTIIGNGQCVFWHGVFRLVDLL
jgi:hypothetical protein